MPKTQGNFGQQWFSQLRVDLLGALPIFALGSALHFAYDWFGEWPPMAMFAAVNESVWEHLKIAFWPALLWASIHSALRRPDTVGFWAARSLGLVTISLTIVAVFYGYTAALGENLLAIDILTFATAIFAGQATSNLALPLVRRGRLLRKICVVLLLAQIAAFATFTYATPHWVILKDPRNGLYGLHAHQSEPGPLAD